MKVELTNSNLNKINFTSKPQRKTLENKKDSFELSAKKTNKQENKVKNFFSKFKTTIIALLSAIGGGLLVFGATNSQTKKIKKENEILEQEINKANEKNKAFEEQFKKIVLPDDISAKVKAKQEELDAKQLSYNPTETINKKNKIENKANSVIKMDLPKEHKKLDLRSDAQQLVYPNFIAGKPYYFEFPQSSNIKIAKDYTTATPKEKSLTTVSESYADSLVWDNDKIARDLLQNFYDGHGQTLDGVKFEVTPKENGTHRVKISGLSTYSADKAILLGESSKKTNQYAAGNYGEGLKMVVLKLLREKGADKVDIASNDWKVTWNFEESDFNKKVLAYEINNISPIDGNYIEFDVNDISFVESIINTFDRFYHYNNKAFKCPDFENDILGIKLINKEENGRIYIAGQAFELNEGYEDLKGMNIYIKQKPPLKYEYMTIFDPSRDRISLTKDNLKALAKWISAPENLSREDAVKLIKSLEEYWDVGTASAIGKHQTKGVAFISGLWEGLYDRGDININFPEKCVADYWNVSNGLIEMYENAGYKICSCFFERMGMRSITELVNETRKHKPIKPTEVEKNKILIIQQAVKLLSPYIENDKLFDEKELEPKIYIFDNSANNEDTAYKNVLGEAIVEDEKSLGFWIDRQHLNNGSFSAILSTSLHEMTHKFGGDESEAFSYKLTDVMQKVLEAMNENPNLAVQLKVLEEAWNMQL